MTSIDAQLAREFFELNGFRVHTVWAQHQRSDGAVQMYVERDEISVTSDPELILSVEDLPKLSRALVEVRPWHTERLYSSVIENNPILTQFARPENTLHAREFFNDRSFRTVLITSELPSNLEQRSRTAAAIASSPVDHVIEFATILRHLIGAVNVNSSYTASATLQLLQLLKRYRLIQHQQMEFQFPLDGPPLHVTPKVETATPATEEGDKYEDDEWE